MKHIYLLLAALCLTTAAYADDTTTDHNYVNGLCTADHTCSARYDQSKATSVPTQSNGVYQLNSVQDFLYFAELSRSTSNTLSAQLNVDVDLSVTWANSSTRTSWVPMGKSSSNSTINFDGNGHSIKNLYIDNSSRKYVGLFARLTNSTISNLYVKATTINGSTDFYSYGGIIAAWASGCTFTNCYTYDTTVTTNCSAFGGIVGYTQNNNTLTNCYNLSTINSQPAYKPSTGSYIHIGGIVGQTNTATLTHCFNQGKITITPSKGTFTGARCGGIVATVANGTTFTRCYNSATIEKPSTNYVTSSYVGAFAGYAAVSSTITYSECYARLSNSTSAASTLVGYYSSSTRNGLSMLRQYSSQSSDYAYYYTLFGSSVLSDDEGGTHNEFILDTDGNYIDNVVFNNSSNDYTKPNLVKNLVLTDATPYAANATYYAEKFTFTRSITEGNTFSFILPMEILSANVPDGCPLYMLSSIDSETNTLYFKTASFIQANLPYLVIKPTASAFNITASNVNNRYSRSMVNSVSNGTVTVTHIGSYLPQSYTEDDTNSYYGYKSGQFVKAKKSKLKPFRTMLRYTNSSTSGTAPLAFNISLDGETTGLVTPELQSLTVDVYDLSGRKLRTAVSSATAIQGLPTGTYIVGGKKVIKK